MTRTELIQHVALRMDEITPSAGVVVTVDGSDNNPLYSLIDGLIDSGVLELFSVSPYWRLPQTPFTYSTGSDNQISVEELDPNDDESRQFIRLLVPDDFLRVAEIDCPDFQRPITEVFPEQSDMGKRQHNRFLRGREAKPVGVMSFGSWNGSLCREIDCYSLSPDTQVSADDVTATYIAKPEKIYDDPQQSQSVSVEDALGGTVLIPALEWLIASRAFGARGDSNHAATCQQNAQNLLV